MSQPDPPETVGQVLQGIAAAHPDRVAVIDTDGTRTTYRELLERSSRLANALASWGVTPGDRVAAWLEDGHQYVELYVACALGGFVVTPLNSRYTVYEVRGILEDAEPRVIAWSAPKDGAVEELVDSGTLGDVARLRHSVGGPQVLDAWDWESVVSQGSTVVTAHPRADDLLVIGFTSGTTGRPKGALLTHSSVRAVMRQNYAAYRLPFHSVIAMTGSMSFVSVVPSHVLTHLAIAGTVVFLGQWDVPRLIDVVEEHRATFTYLPSPVLDDFAEHASRSPQRWASLHSVLHSASKGSLQSLAAVAETVGTRLVEGWGMTENSGGLMTATTAEDIAQLSDRPGLLATVGRAISGYEVRAVADELEFRGAGLAKGYWRRPDATAAAFRDGWFSTGDVGSVDADGYVTLLERRTDLIVSGGMNVYPAEVEAVIISFPGVAECAVVGAPHPRWGQTVVAVVVAREGVELVPQQIIEHCRTRLAGYKKPTEVVTVTALPRTVAMKISRAAVRTMVTGPPP